MWQARFLVCKEGKISDTSLSNTDTNNLRQIRKKKKLEEAIHRIKQCSIHCLEVPSNSALLSEMLTGASVETLAGAVIQYSPGVIMGFTLHLDISL